MSDLADNAAVDNDEEMKALRPWLKTFDNAMSKFFKKRNG
jgi:hypothetical protein